MIERCARKKCVRAFEDWWNRKPESGRLPGFGLCTAAPRLQPSIDAIEISLFRGLRITIRTSTRRIFRRRPHGPTEANPSQATDSQDRNEAQSGLHRKRRSGQVRM